MQVGIDIVYIPEFSERFSSGSLQDVFTADELSHATHIASKAGIFAAKEAYMKAYGEKCNWQDVWLEYTEVGKPLLKNHHALETTVSISHEREYAVAVVIIP
ncbi:MAG: holo-ACP synthase [Patescibacteria group bacterium]